MSSRYTDPLLTPKARPSARDYLIRLFVYELRRGAVCRGPDPDQAEIDAYVQRLRALEARDARELLAEDRAGEATMAVELRARALQLEPVVERLVALLVELETWELDDIVREAPVPNGRSSSIRSALHTEVTETRERIENWRAMADKIDAELAADPGDGEKVRSAAIVRIADQIVYAKRNLDRRAHERKAVAETSAMVAASIVKAFPPDPALAGAVELLLELRPSHDEIDGVYEIDRIASGIAARILVNGNVVKDRTPGSYPGWVIFCDDDGGCDIVLEGSPEGRAAAEQVVEAQRRKHKPQRVSVQVEAVRPASDR